MAIDDLNPNHRDSDCDLTELLHQTFCTEAARAEFVVRLQDALRTEVPLVAHGSGPADAAAGELPRPVKVEAGEILVSGPSAVSFPRRRRTGQSFAAAAMAAVIVTAVAIWSSRPSYSWTSMVRALEAQPWIESAAAGETGESVRNWFSRTRRVVIRRSDEGVVWDDLAAGVRSHYQTGSDVLERSRIAAASAPSVEQLLVSSLLKQAGQFPGVGVGSGSGPIHVIRQAWRERSDADGQWIELDVELSWGAREEERLHLLLRLDPASQLPQSCTVVEAGDVDRPVIEFEYPTEGPRQVYELGVPRSVAIVDRDDPSPFTRVVEAPSESTVQSLIVRADGIDSERPAPPVADILPGEIAEATPAATTAARVPAAVPAAVSSGEMTERVDSLWLQLWDRNGITPAGESSDLEFLRRVSLDLTGRVPTVSEVRAFSGDDAAGRRERLVEQLLARRDHATHLASVWRRFLLPEGVDLTQYGGTASFEQWLTDHFRANTPYDEVVRELLLAEGRVSESGPILFYTALKMAPEALAAQTARAFLGMRLECAQCHDHFFDNRWKQQDFWGYAAFFARISRPEGKMEMISPVLQVKDTNWGDVTLPEQEEIVPPRYPLGDTLVEGARSASRRQELADWMTAPDNPHFARATVNRVWAHLFGRGIVEPVDDMRSDHPPVCPEVLEELAGHLVSTGFDLRELFRVIVLSQTYQRSSAAADDDPSRTLHFAQMNIKSFTAEQLYDSIAVATRLEAPAADDGSLMRERNLSRQAFLDQFRAPPGQVTDYPSGIPQALTLMNGRLIQSATGLQSSGILRSLEAPFFSNEQRVETLFLATLSRPPDDAERQTMVEYVTSPGADRGERLSDILWALLNSAEFTLNH
ncbi:MAG: DUF1549 and DUF1553 domain-containing protein [Planctomycetaceae bacterium]